jgi:hypothetical protein
MRVRVRLDSCRRMLLMWGILLYTMERVLLYTLGNLMRGASRGNILCNPDGGEATDAKHRATGIEGRVRALLDYSRERRSITGAICESDGEVMWDGTSPGILLARD